MNFQKNKKKHIWIINEYAGSPYHGIEYRSYYIAKELIKIGYDVTIVSSNFSHLFKKTSKPGFEYIDGIRFFWVKTFDYKNSKNKLRVIKWFLFTIKLFFVLFKLEKPDYIVVSPMQTMPVFPGWLFSKIYKAKLIFEVKDIWPKSLINLGKFSENNPLIRILSFFESFALKKSDLIISSLERYDLHILEKGINRDFAWICNGFDLDEVNKVENLSDELSNKVPNGKFIVGYTGTVGIANALEYFCESSLHLENDNIYLVIVGDGQEKTKLKKKYLHQKNLIFIDRIKKQQVQSMIQKFDVCFIGCHDEELYKYGISPNKIFDYMFSAKPIIHSFDGNGDLVKNGNCGITIVPENASEIADAINKMYNMTKEERANVGLNGKQYLLNNFTYEKLALKFHHSLEKLK